MTDLNIVQQPASPKSKRLASQSADVADEGLEELVAQFLGLDRELKDSATKVDALQKKDLRTVVSAAQVVYEARKRGRAKYIAFCKRVAEKGVTLKGSRKRRYAKMGERADRLLEVVDLVKNESVAYEIARLAEADYKKLKGSGSLTKEMTKGDLEKFLGCKRAPSIFVLRLPKKGHSIPVTQLCMKLTELVEAFPEVPRKGTGEFEQFSRSA